MVKRLKSSNHKSNSALPSTLPSTTTSQKQNQLIAYFVSDQGLAVLAAPDLQISDADRRDFLRMLREDQITPDRLATFLRAIPLPDYSDPTLLEKTFKRLAKQPRTKQILAIANGYSAKNWEEVDSAAIRRLLGNPTRRQPDYRTPVDFVTFRNTFLDDIRPQASPEQLQEYESAFDTFESLVYGDRFTYYDIFRTLLREAKDDQPAQAAPTSKEPSTTSNSANDTQPTNTITDSNSTSITPTTTTDTAAQPSTSSFLNLIPVPANHRDTILSRAVIEGDPWRQGGQEYRLTIQNLFSANLAPTYELVIDQTLIAFSPCFVLSSGRTAVITYVAQGNQVKVRGYYRSHTSGLWHYLPDYIHGAHAEGIGWVGEAYSPLSTTLPVILQLALDQLLSAHGTLNITTINTDFLLASTAYAYDSQQDYRTQLARGQMRGDFYREVDPTPISTSSSSSKTAPQLVTVSADLQPNLQQPLASSVSHSQLAGDFSCYVYNSYSDQYRWLFCSDERGRSWVGTIDAISPLTSTGCNAHWVSAGDILTPLYLPNAEANGYGDPTDTRRGHIGMWNTYLSKIPLIQSFLTSRPAR